MVGTLPRAFPHLRLGHVDALVMFKRLNVLTLDGVGRVKVVAGIIRDGSHEKHR